MNIVMELDSIRQLHDMLLAQQPSGAAHEGDTCPICASNGTLDPAQGGEMSTFTQEELDQAIADATGPLKKAMEDLQASQQESEVETRIATVKVEAEAKIAEVQATLDLAVLGQSEAERQYSELVAFLEGQQAEQEAAAELAKRKEDRLAMVKDVASFPDEYLVANADRWAGLADEEFEALVSDWKAISTAKHESSDDGLPKVTAMVASRTDDGSKSVLSEVLAWNLQGIDPKTL